MDQLCSKISKPVSLASAAQDRSNPLVLSSTTPNLAWTKVLTGTLIPIEKYEDGKMGAARRSSDGGRCSSPRRQRPNPYKRNAH